MQGSPRIARSELPNCCAALEHEAQVHQALLGEVVKEMVLRNVDYRRTPPFSSALVVSCQIAFRDQKEVTSMPVLSMTSNLRTYVPSLSRLPR